MKRRVFIHESPRKPVGGMFLPVTVRDARLRPGATIEFVKKTYYVGLGGELRRLYK